MKMADFSQLAAASPSNGEAGDNHQAGDLSPGSSNPDGTSLDTTLLESLFYNEMMMLGDSADFLTTITGGAETQQQPNASSDESDEAPVPNSGKQPRNFSAEPTNRESAADPITEAEQSLLRDFGVSGSPVPAFNDEGAKSSGEGYLQAGNEAKQQQKQLQPQPTANTQPQPAQHQQQQQQQQQSWSQQYYQQPNQDQNYNPYQHPNHQGAHYQEHAYPPHPHPNQHYQPYPSSLHAARAQAPPPPPLQQQPERMQSRGIKHSVKPKPEPPKHQEQSAYRAAKIPNPLSPQHQQQQHSPPSYAPPPQHYYHHCSHPPPPPAQPYHYHQPYPHPPPPHPGNAPPNLVPVPAPTGQYTQQPGNHERTAFGPPQPVPPPLPPQQQHYSSPPPPTGPVTIHPAPVAHPHSHSHSQPPKQQLVSQFATLANRLGINLPPDLLKSLTESAGAISASGEGHAITSENLKQLALSIKSSEGATSTAKWEREKKSDGLKLTGGKSDASSSRPASVASSASSGAQLESTPPEVSALRKTAEEAVAAISRKRYLDDARATCGNGSDSNSNKPSYNKRRKRPRLVDIESRLEKLREENKLLKQHLDNVTSQTKKFDEERAKTEEAMKRMMMEAEGASDEELNAVIRDYTEMYSDYGKRRHQELSFHLEQLQKLANPTNFTKMGLWTIAKANGSKDMSKQNPLIGILQKELNITPQQTRKILEQRAKIRDLCSNLNASLVLLQKLKDLCEQKNKTFNDRMNKTKEILTPKQVVKLIMFVKDYSDVLGNICPGWTSEQVVKKKAPIAMITASTNGTNTASATEKTVDTVSESSTSFKPSEVSSQAPPT